MSFRSSYQSVNVREKGDGRIVTESPDWVRTEQSCLEFETLAETREKLAVKK